MFDFFRDMVLELCGVDSENAEKQRKEKREAKRKDRFIFSQSVKVLVYVFGILYCRWLYHFGCKDKWSVKCSYDFEVCCTHSA